jgi:hypothetical protein
MVDLRYEAALWQASTIRKVCFEPQYNTRLLHHFTPGDVSCLLASFNLWLISRQYAIYPSLLGSRKK